MPGNKRSVLTAAAAAAATATVIVVAAAVLGYAMVPDRAAGTVARSAPADAVEERMREYILRNPEVILESMRRLEAGSRVSAADEVKALVAAHAADLYEDPDSPMSGDLAGDVTLVEFFDYNCPYCRRVTPTMTEAARRDPKLRIVYKEFPILGPNSLFAARAALASHRQGKYLPFHQAMMQAGGLMTQERVLELAQDVGLDEAQLRRDMDDPRVSAAIERNLNVARALRISATPTFVIGDEIVRGAVDLEMMQAAVDRARRRQ